MIAIHQSNFGFHPRWAAYCEQQGIPYKRVDCHASDLIEQLHDCSALMWHHNHNGSTDSIVAKQILFALEHTGLVVFPDFRTGWHFDDKVGQKYLFERLGVPFVPSYVFFTKQDATDWADSTSFPKVFKLRGGAGSSNVRLIKSRTDAQKVIRQAFGRGFPNYDAWGSLKERFRKFRLKKTDYIDVMKGIARLAVPPMFAKVMGREVGYVYFQDFIADNSYDIRIIVIDHKAFALKRLVRENDFRASGSGFIIYDKNEIDERCVQLGLDINKHLKSQSAVFDFVFDASNNPLLIEVSYGFAHEAYDPCPGYWDADLNWHEGPFNPQGWMVDAVVALVENRNREKMEALNNLFDEVNKAGKYDANYVGDDNRSQP